MNPNHSDNQLASTREFIKARTQRADDASLPLTDRDESAHDGINHVASVIDFHAQGHYSIVCRLNPGEHITVSIHLSHDPERTDNTNQSDGNS